MEDNDLRIVINRHIQQSKPSKNNIREELRQCKTMIKHNTDLLNAID